MQDNPAVIAPIIPIAANARWQQGLLIRPASPDDAEGIAAMQNQPEFRAGTLRPPYVKVQDVRKWLETPAPNAISIVAVMSDRIVGHAGFTQSSGRRSHVASLGMGVHDAFQRRGIGRALLGELVAIADNWMNIKRLELTVYTDNTGAIALYESFGFEREGLHRAFAFRDGSFVDAYAMARIRP